LRAKFKMQNVNIKMTIKNVKILNSEMQF